MKAVNQASFQSRVGFQIELLCFRRFLRGLINWSKIYPLLAHGDSPRFIFSSDRVQEGLIVLNDCPKAKAMRALGYVRG